MSENVRKLIGVAVMAAIVVVGVVATSGDDSDSSRTRNAAFAKGGVMAKEAPPAKGGDCCDETLYRLGQIEDRLSQIETSLQRALPLVRDAQMVDNGPTADQILATLEAWLEQDPLIEDPRTGDPANVARAFEQSGVLLGVPLQTAQEAVNLTGVGFVHSEEDGHALDPVPYWGTRRSPQGRSGLVRVETRNGLVSDAISWTRN